MGQTRSAQALSAYHGRTPGGGTLPAQQGFSLAQLRAALRELPPNGWNSRWTGRRDRALLVLSEMSGLSYDTIAQLTVGDIKIAGGVATISTPGGTTTLHSDDDVLLCGPCALARWIHALDLATAHPTGRVAAAVIARAAPLTERSPHLCECTVTVADAALQVPILPVTDAWGPRLPARESGTETGSGRESSGNADELTNVLAFPLLRRGAPVGAGSTAASANLPPAALPVRRSSDGPAEPVPTAAVALRLSNYFRTDLDTHIPISNVAATLAGRAKQLLEHPADDHVVSATEER